MKYLYVPFTTPDVFVQNVFNYVPHDILLNKLVYYGFRNVSLSSMKTYFTNHFDNILTILSELFYSFFSIYSDFFVNVLRLLVKWRAKLYRLIPTIVCKCNTQITVPSLCPLIKLSSFSFFPKNFYFRHLSSFWCTFL